MEVENVVCALFLIFPTALLNFPTALLIFPTASAPATSVIGPPAFLPLSSPPSSITNSLSPIDRPSHAMASTAGFHGSLPASLQYVLKQGGTNNPPFSSSLVLEPSNYLGSSDSASSVVFGEPSQFSDYSNLANVLLGIKDSDSTGASATAHTPSVVGVSSHDFQELSPAFVSSYSVIPSFSLNPAVEGLQQQDDEEGPLVQEVQPATLGLLDNTDLTNAITDFINDILTAIGDLITAIQDALADTPLLALLLLLGLILLPFLLKEHGHKGYSGGGGYGGGGYHRRVYYIDGARSLVTDSLLQRILIDIETLEHLLNSLESRELPEDIETLLIS